MLLYERSISVNADLFLTFALVLETHSAINEGKEGVILAYSDIFTCANSGSALSDDDVACDDVLTVSLLYAEALGLTVTAVLGRTYAFLMSKEL